MERNNILTASRLSKFLHCQRAHYWAHEVGLRKAETSLALKVGSAWARAMEARWNHLDFDNALAAALPDGVELTPYDCATVAGLLAAYYKYYGERETVGNLFPEVQFSRPMPLSKTFHLAGKLDGLGQLRNNLPVIVEAKTTGDSLDSGSAYWLRLRFNMQVLGYVVEARHSGWNVSTVFYDVTRKPMIKPRHVDDLDEQGRKVVIDQRGERVLKNNGEPRLSADKEKGYTVKSHLETPDEYSDRLTADILSRPEFYFARREVPILDDDLQAFETQRNTIAQTILYMRRSEKRLKKPEDAWPRNVSEMNCRFCSFQSFCLSNISVDPQHPPQGFTIGRYNQELEYDNTTEEVPAAEDNPYGPA